MFQTATSPSLLMRYRKLCDHLSLLRSPVLLLARWHVAAVFFSSGLTKLRDWETTLMLFTDEYQVPLLSPVTAAYMGTAGELLLPMLLLFGLFGELAALGLFMLNIVAVLSLTEIAPAALHQHQLWGSLLLALALWGPGVLSIDYVLKRRDAMA
jgi:putative oxidoreductase